MSVQLFSNLALAKNIDGKKTAAYKPKWKPLSQVEKSQVLLEILAESESRGAIFKAIAPAMKPEDYRFALEIAQKKNVDLRSPLSLKINSNGQMTIGNNEKVAWNHKKSGMIFRDQIFAHNQKLSMRENFKKIEAQLRAQKTAGNIFINSAYAADVGGADMDATLTDLNYVLYVMANKNNEKELEKINAAQKLDPKMKSLVQDKKFLSMSCSAGAHSATATVTFGDGANNTEIILQDNGQGELTRYVKKPGGGMEEVPFSDKKKKQMQFMFDEICVNNTDSQVQENSSTIYDFGGSIQ